MQLEDLLCGGFTTLPPAFVHSSATDERLLAMPTSAADAARRFKKMMRGTTKSQFVPTKAAESGDPTPPPVPETPTRIGKQVAVEEGDPLATVVFDIPTDALPPPPPRAAVARLPPPTALPVQPVAPPPAFKGAVQDDAAAQPVESEGFGAFGEVQVLEAAPASAAAAVGAAAEAQEEWAQFGDGELAPMPMPQQQQPPPRVISPKDVQDSLHLVEVWHGEVVGGQLVSAGVEGSVVRKLAPYGLQAARFQVLPSGRTAVDACLRTAGMNRAFAERVAGNASPHFLATFQRASIGCAYLTYM